MPSNFLQQLGRRRLVFDGAMGTATHSYDLSVERDYCGCENCTEILVRSRPDVIGAIHESFLTAGCDVLETCTFGGMPHVLAEFGLEARAYELNKAAAELARSVCDKHSTRDKPRFVAGSIGPGTKLVTLGNIAWDAMFASYREQARGLIDGGADCFIIETCQDLLQVKCAINAVVDALMRAGKTPADVPLMVSVTIESTGTMLLGTEIAAAAHALAGYPICSLGLNCATGPVEMRDHVKWLGQHWPAMGTIPGTNMPRVVSVMPNAGLPVVVAGKPEFPLGAGAFAEAMEGFLAEQGVWIVGGCCGTKPDHIKALAREVESMSRSGRTAGRRLVVNPPHCAAPPASVTSLYSPQTLRQDTSILIIGERMNASGSRAFKRLLEGEDWDGIVSLAREQVRHDGAHVLDLNVDYAGRDNARDMAEIVRRLVRQVNVPLMLDSTQVATIEAGLRSAGGKCIINSANFEDGEEKFDRICRLAQTYGSGLVIGSIDEDREASMARTAERKLAIAERAHERAVKVHGLSPEDLLFDPLVLPISTGMESDRRSGLETIEGVRRIMERFPASQTTLGLSNCSFGLKPAARVVLNSVFLHELQEAGLTSAIVHFSKVLPRNRIDDAQWNAALDLVYDRRRDGYDPLQAFVALFPDADAPGATTRKAAKERTLEEALRGHIVDGEKEGLETTLKAALEKYTPLQIINDHLLDGMKTVGELFGSGQMQLPFVLQSAEVMKAAVSVLEPLMEKVGGRSKGTIVLATVKGDVHDIGKNLVDIILSNNGYKVVNLGIKQPIADITRAWREHQADAIGMSGLLVKSVNVMEENLRELNTDGLAPPVLLGGAALTRHYCESHLRSIYQGPCYFGRDAFEGLRTMDYITAGRHEELAVEIQARLDKRTAAEDEIVASRIERLARAGGGGDPGGGVRSEVASDVPVPRAPFFGSRIIDALDLDHVYPFINPIALFRGQWQIRKGASSDQEYEALIEDEVRPIFNKWKEFCKRERILLPAVAYGYFPCNSEGNDLIIWEDERRSRERLRFNFPRQAGRRRLCISDFFRPAQSSEVDVIGMSCVTMGPRVGEYSRELFASNNYTDYLYVHGLGVETAEALAEFWHKRMRQELGIAGDDSPNMRELFTQHYRGSRYSFGYPACPVMEDQEKLFELLDPGRIGCVLTENWQIDPEQSTSAIVVHHPEAKYFNV